MARTLWGPCFRHTIECRYSTICSLCAIVELGARGVANRGTCMRPHVTRAWHDCRMLQPRSFETRKPNLKSASRHARLMTVTHVTSLNENHIEDSHILSRCAEQCDTAARRRYTFFTQAELAIDSRLKLLRNKVQRCRSRVFLVEMRLALTMMHDRASNP